MGLNTTDSFAILEALAPSVGFRTDLALISSYSVDLLAVAAVIQALSGHGRDNGQVGSSSLARALELMHDRFRVICQAGRVAVPRAGVKNLVIADRWVREVRKNANEGSWHAKLGFFRYKPDTGENKPEWRLWMGSRNLTRDTSWDSALLAIATKSNTTNAIDESIARAGEVLARKAELPNWSPSKVLDELKGLHWNWSDDFKEVVSFKLWPDAEPAEGLPRPPKNLKHIVAIGPFVNGSIAKKLSVWGGDGVRRQLLTTRSTYSALKSLAGKPTEGFCSVHHLDESIGFEDPLDEELENDEDQMVEMHRGLHAKLLWTHSSKSDQLWLGSANLTERGWNGSNTEAVIHAKVSRELGQELVDGLVDGIAELADSGDEDTDCTTTVCPIEQTLDYIRNRISATWEAILEYDSDKNTVRCTTGESIVLLEDPAELLVRLMGQSNWVVWQPTTCVIDFHPPKFYEMTEWIEFRLCSNEEPEIYMTWIARADMQPALDISRDRAVLARLMGPQAFLVMLRGLLGEVTGDRVDDPWPERPEKRVTKPLSPSGSFSNWRGPTLEFVLRTWANNPQAVREVDKVLKSYIPLFRKELSEKVEIEEVNALKDLERFETAWREIRAAFKLS